MGPRVRKALLWSAAAIPVLMVLTWVAASLWTSSRLENTLASLKAGGFATSLEELAPPAVPDDRNGAADYLAAFALPSEDENEAFEKAQETPFAELSAEEKAAVLDLLGKSAPLFEKIRSGRRRGGCRYPRDYARGVAMELEDIPGLMRACRLLNVRAQAEPAEAREAVLDILALSESYRREPLLVAQLVRFVSLDYAVDAIHLRVTADTPEAELRAWLELVPAPEILDGAVELGFRGELATAARLALRPDETLGSKAPLPNSGLAAPWWRLSCARHLDSMRRVVEMSGKPYLQARAELEAYNNDLLPKRGFLDMVSLMLFPATTRALDRQRITQASLAVLRAGLSAELGKAVDVPDPLTGRPLVMKDGAIQSVGEDLENDRLIWKVRKK